MAKNKEEKVLRSENEGLFLKEDGVKIIQITADGSGVVYGMGNDQKMYVWHHSLYFAGNWVLHVSPKKKEDDGGPAGSVSGKK